MEIEDIKNFIVEVFAVYLIYLMIAICIILCIIIIIKTLKERKKKAHFYFYYFNPVANNHIIDAIINIFSYGFIHNKQIGIMITKQFEMKEIVEYNFKAEFSYHNLKFFLQHGQVFTIFINQTGIIYGITTQKIDIQNIFNIDSYLFITSQLENKKYTLFVQEQMLKDKDIYHMQIILKEFLQRSYSL